MQDPHIKAFTLCPTNPSQDASRVISWVSYFLLRPLKKQWIEVSVQSDRDDKGETSTCRNLLGTRIFSCTIWLHSRFYKKINNQLPSYTLPSKIIH